MADRYFVETPISGAAARLVGAEAHHLIRVMRAKPGDEITLFDGTGAEFTARVVRIGRSELEFAIVARLDVSREALVAVTLGVSLPKPDRARWLVEKATELGIACLVPLVTERSTQRASSAGVERLRRTVIEASKQCGRNRLMHISQPQPLADYLAAAPSGGLRLLGHPNADTYTNAMRELLSHPAPRNAWLAVGPEGGFTDVEIELAICTGWRVVGFGPRTLRVETAALTLAASVVAALERD